MCRGAIRTVTAASVGRALLEFYTASETPTADTPAAGSH